MLLNIHIDGCPYLVEYDSGFGYIEIARMDSGDVAFRGATPTIEVDHAELKRRRDFMEELTARERDFKKDMLRLIDRDIRNYGRSNVRAGYD